MPDTVTVKTSQGCLSRFVGSIVGIGIGLVLLVAAVPLLWWNEGRSIHRARALEEGAAVVVHVAPDALDAAHDGKLVHLTGEATTAQTLADPDFGVSAPAIRLVRIAETYQWKESSKSTTRKKFGGGEETTTTYSYSKAWSSQHVDSSSFHSPEGHENPPSLEWESRTLTADTVTCGAFTLSPDLVGMIGRAQARPLTQEDAQAVQAAGFALSQNAFYKGANPSSPHVGDVRVRFEVVLPQKVSIVAAQRGAALESYQARAGSSILLLKEGEVSAAEMFRAAEAENALIKWLVRAGGFLAMFIGLVLVLRPISVLGSVVPLVGTLLGAGTALVSFLVALVLWTTVVAVAWIAYRPLLGGALILASAAIVLFVVRWRRKRAPKPVVPPPIPTGV